MTEPQEKPRVEMLWRRDWCARHLEPFRAEWPRGAVTAMIMLYNAAVQMPAIVDAAAGDSARIEAAFERFKPLCCFVDAGTLAAIYSKAGVTP